jgi:hypothetical protein
MRAVACRERHVENVAGAGGQLPAGLGKAAGTQVTHHWPAGRRLEDAGEVKRRHACRRRNVAQRKASAEVTFDVPEGFLRGGHGLSLSK